MSKQLRIYEIVTPPAGLPRPEAWVRGGIFVRIVGSSLSRVWRATVGDVSSARHFLSSCACVYGSVKNPAVNTFLPVCARENAHHISSSTSPHTQCTHTNTHTHKHTHTHTQRERQTDRERERLTARRDTRGRRASRGRACPRGSRRTPVRARVVAEDAPVVRLAQAHGTLDVGDGVACLFLDVLAWGRSGTHAPAAAAPPLGGREVVLGSVDAARAGTCARRRRVRRRARARRARPRRPAPPPPLISSARRAAPAAWGRAAATCAPARTTSARTRSPRRSAPRRATRSARRASALRAPSSASRRRRARPSRRAGAPRGRASASQRAAASIASAYYTAVRRGAVRLRNREPRAPVDARPGTVAVGTRAAAVGRRCGPEGRRLQHRDGIARIAGSDGHGASGYSSGDFFGARARRPGARFPPQTGRRGARVGGGGTGATRRTASPISGAGDGPAAAGPDRRARARP